MNGMILLSAGWTAPPAPRDVWVPQEPETFAQGLWQLCRAVISQIRPEIADAAGLCLAVLAIAVMLSLLQPLCGPGKRSAELVCTFGISAVLLEPATSMVQLAVDTVTELTQYSKLLLPVMTSALAAQGGVTKSAALYAGTAALITVVTAVNTSVVVPTVYMYLAMAMANSALGDDSLKRFRDFMKSAAAWVLRTSLTLFSGYMGLTGMIQGTTDAAALKATRLALSSAVPVVGGMLSDASETVLLSAGILKHTAGVYGMLVILSMSLRPFLKIAIPYVMLKLTAGISSIFASPQASELIGDFSSAMGLLLAVTGTICLLMMISTVCFLKGVGI